MQRGDDVTTRSPKLRGHTNGIESREGVGVHATATDLVPGKGLAFHKKNGEANSGQARGDKRAGRSGANHDHIPDATHVLGGVHVSTNRCGQLWRMVAVRSPAA